MLLTRRGNTVYVHLHRDPVTDAVKLKPIRTLPVRATLLNDGRPVECAADVLPSEHVTQTPCLRLKRLPVNELCNEVLVVKLEFADGTFASGEARETAGGADVNVM